MKKHTIPAYFNYTNIIVYCCRQWLLCSFTVTTKCGACSFFTPPMSPPTQPSSYLATHPASLSSTHPDDLPLIKPPSQYHLPPLIFTHPL